MLRAKFVVVTVSRHQGMQGEEIVARPVYPQRGVNDTEENKSFWQASPNGELKLGITNPEAIGKLQLGHAYYIDFTEAPD